MSETDQEPFTAPASIGEMLRQARERRGETLVDVAHALKLSPYQVEALELERFDLLPGPAFVRGFLRNFARHVRLDLDARIAALDLGGGVPGARLSTVTNASGEIPAGGERASKGVRPALVIVAGMVLALGAGWYFDWFKLDDQPQNVAPRMSIEAPATAPLAESPRLGAMEAPPLMSVPSAPGRDAPDQDATTSDQATESIPEGQPESDPVATETRAEGVEATAALEETATDAIAQTPPVNEISPASELEGDRLSFALRGESWIQVRDRDGVALYTGTGAPGSTRVVQGQPPFAIVVGNAAMVSLEFNGRPVDLSPHTGSSGVARMTVQ